MMCSMRPWRPVYQLTSAGTSSDSAHEVFRISIGCLSGEMCSHTPKRYDEITGSCYVVEPNRQPDSPGKCRNGRQPQASVAGGGKPGSSGTQTTPPLRAIKYSSAIRHRALGCGPAALCSKPPIKRLLKTTKQWGPACKELQKQL